MIGIIGGTGLYQLEGMSELTSREIETPFGKPSAPISVGKLEGREVAFLPRHGLHHELLPGEINFRANLYALKKIGVREILSVSAVGSLAREIEPGQLAAPSQYLDFTRGRREHTFFGGGLVAHVSTAEPVCARLVAKLGSGLHTGKTYACVEGPRLGNRAESEFLRRSGAHLVGMTNVPEVYLAREAQLCYATIAVVTDYDCWMEDPAQHVSALQVFPLYRQSLGKVRALLRQVVLSDHGGECSCRHALAHAVLTDPVALAPAKRELLECLRS
ncbi:MAG: S-methyl-5'-thioadenosine phosphorylase [Bdellovibrionota bacterium]